MIYEVRVVIFSLYFPKSRVASLICSFAGVHPTIVNVNGLRQKIDFSLIFFGADATLYSCWIATLVPARNELETNRCQNMCGRWRSNEKRKLTFSLRTISRDCKTDNWIARPAVRCSFASAVAFSLLYGVPCFLLRGKFLLNVCQIG